VPDWGSAVISGLPASRTLRPMTDLVIVGGGKMGEALLGGLLANGTDAASVTVVEPVEARRRELEDRHGVATAAEPVAASGAILATKPDIVPAAAAALGVVGVDRVLSVAAGVTIATMEKALGRPIPVVRAMPNTPALVGEGAAAIAGNAHASEADLVWAEAILGAVGVVVRVPEKSLDAVTGLSGSGPAYLFLVAEAMVEAGVLMGLPRDVSVKLATQTLLGASTLLAEGRPAAELRGDVTSPGGTTAAGLRALEDGGVRAAFLNAVEAATLRSRELGAS
jgi:pyrroline-5-carboxylate reductase